LKPQIPWLRVFVEGVVIVGTLRAPLNRCPFRCRLSPATCRTAETESGKMTRSVA